VYRFDQAFARISGKEYDEAIDIVTKLLAEKSDNIEALRMRSEAYRLSGKKDKADEDFAAIRRLQSKTVSGVNGGAAKESTAPQVVDDAGRTAIGDSSADRKTLPASGGKSSETEVTSEGGGQKAPNPATAESEPKVAPSDEAEPDGEPK
jgi:hypothetical protein